MTNLSGTNLNNGSAVGPQGEGRDSPSNFPKYPAYKDSGVEWLGEVPEHWVVRKVSVDFSATKGPRGALLTKEYCHENSGEYPVYSGQTENGGVLGEIADYDFDLGKEGAILSTTVGAKAMSVSHVTGRISLSQNCMIIKSINPNIGIKFFFYHFQPLFLLERKMIPDHMQPSFRMEDLYAFRIATPPEKEQTQIARFLDHETARIDALIEEQQRLIELLKEKRQAVISHAVTKGLDPTVPMKDSGVEWLGEVPAHWELKKLRHIGHARNGLTYSPEDVVDFSDSATLVLRSSNIQKARIRLEDNVYVEKRIPEALRVREGDLLICSRNGSRALIGKNALIPKELDGQSFGAFMMVFRSGVNKFIYWVLNSPIFDYQSSTFLTATINQLTNENLGGMLAPFPPPAEQAEIVSFLTEKSQEIDILISEVQGGVELLYERRSALISAAVTGKIDVRSWQPPASAQAPELAVAEAD